jgi:hypothetical protein
MIKVCFVALNAYPAIDPRVPGGFGGIETRAWMFARGLATRDDVDVSFVVRHWEPLRQPVYDNVRLILLRDRLYPLRDSVLSRIDRQKGWPRLQDPRWSDLFVIPLLAAGKLMRPRRNPLDPAREFTRIDADLFVTFGVQSNSATVIASTRSVGRPAILFLGSDNDLDERYLGETGYVSIYRDRADVCRWAIEHADRILCQTESQQELLQTRFQRTGDVVHNPIDIDQWDRSLDSPLHTDNPLPSPCALWIGRADAEHKRPQVLVELACRCPEVSFLMVMNPRDAVVEKQVRQLAPRNVTIIDRVPFDRMPEVFSRAAVLVNTSSLEGFPNTFLQAAVSGVPIASLNVEREFLERSEGGFCAQGDLDALAEYVQRTWNSPRPPRETWPARDYVRRHHDLTTQVNALSTILSEMVDEAQSLPKTT